MSSNRKGKYYLLIIALLTSLLLSAFVSFLIGRYSSVGVGELFSVIKKVVFNITTDTNASAENVICILRAPRIIGACLIGSALALSGSAYQALFGNPIASPDTLGVSNAASFAAVLGIILGLNDVLLKANSFFVGIAVVLLVFYISNKISRGKDLTTYLLLIGMVLSSVFSALLAILKYIADPDNQLPQITYWLMGSLSKVTKNDIKMYFFIFAIGATPIFLLRWRMNLLTLSDVELKAIGENTGVLRAVIITCATLLTASSTAMTGGISWIGLIIPHIVRQIVGPDFKRIIPVSSLLGALFLLIMDDFSRCLTINELPISILTSLVGAPVFFMILVANRGRENYVSRV